MALPATDAFTGTNGDNLTTYSSNWSANLGTISINTNACFADNSGAHSGYHWNADTFADDQYAQVVIASETGGEFIGVTVRAASGTTQTFYKFNVDQSSSYLTKHVAGTLTVIANGSETVDVADTVRLEISGTTLDPQINGTTGSRGTQTDSSIATGSAGVGSFSQNVAARADDWEGGNLSSGTSIAATSDALVLTSYNVTVDAPVSTNILATSDALALTTYQAKVAKAFVSDTFDGTGATNGQWAEHQNDGRVDNIQRQSGYFDGDVTSNAANITEWFNALTGTYHYQTVSFPASGYTEFIIRGVGVGPTGSPQGNLSSNGGYAFTGIMCHVDNDFSTPSYQFAVIGHRGSTTSTVELKSTLSGTSSVGDEGTNVFGTGITHGDLRLRLHSDNTITYDRSVLNADSWTAMTLPATNVPTFGATVNIGMIIYAEGALELPFTGSIDSFTRSIPVEIAATSDALILTEYPTTITTTGPSGFKPVFAKYSNKLIGGM